MLVITDARDKWQEMPVGGPWAKEMVVAANLGKLLETAASVDIISSFPQSWVLYLICLICLIMFPSHPGSCFTGDPGLLKKDFKIQQLVLGLSWECHIMWYLKCLQKYSFSVCVSGGGSFQANQFIGGRQAISWSHKSVFVAVWPRFDVGCNCLVKPLWHFVCRVAHTMEWLGILRKTLLKSIAHLKTEARQSWGEKTWIKDMMIWMISVTKTLWHIATLCDCLYEIVLVNSFPLIVSIFHSQWI